MTAGTSNTAFATTAYVQNLANNSGTLTTNITGNAGTVTNGVYTSGSYSNPTWITALANTKITGVMTASQLAATAVTVGTYGGASQMAVVTVDQQGRITFAANATPSIATTQLTGTITNAYSNVFEEAISPILILSFGLNPTMSNKDPVNVLELSVAWKNNPVVSSTSIPN
jgi:hypothetical protein